MSLTSHKTLNIFHGPGTLTHRSLPQAKHRPEGRRQREIDRMLRTHKDEAGKMVTCPSRPLSPPASAATLADAGPPKACQVYREARSSALPEKSSPEKVVACASSHLRRFALAPLRTCASSRHTCPMALSCRAPVNRTASARVTVAVHAWSLSRQIPLLSFMPCPTWNLSTLHVAEFHVVSCFRPSSPRWGARRLSRRGCSRGSTTLSASSRGH